MKAFRLVAALAASILMAAAAPAVGQSTAPFGSTQSYQFVGQCADCYDGAGVGTATLMLHDYTDADPISSANFVSFTYDGTDLLPAYTITSGDVSYLSGSMTGPYPSTQPFSIFGGSQFFQSYTSGFWCTGGACLADYGFSHSWTKLAAAAPGVPEPSSWAMMIVGLGAMGVALRRRLSDAAMLAA